LQQSVLDWQATSPHESPLAGAPGSGGGDGATPGPSGSGVAAAFSPDFASVGGCPAQATAANASDRSKTVGSSTLAIDIGTLSLASTASSKPHGVRSEVALNARVPVLQ